MIVCKNVYDVKGHCSSNLNHWFEIRGFTFKLQDLRPNVLQNSLKHFSVNRITDTRLKIADLPEKIAYIFHQIHQRHYKRSFLELGESGVRWTVGHVGTPSEFQ